MQDPQDPSAASEPPPPPEPPGAVPPPEPPPHSGAAPRVDIGRWFDGAIDALKENFLEVIIVYLIWHVLVAVGFFLCVIPALVVVGPLTGGLFIYSAKRMLGMPAQIGDLFKGFEKFADTLVVSLLLFVVPMLFLAALAMPLVFALVGAGAASSSGASGVLEAFSCFGAMLAAAGGLVFLIVVPALVGTFLVFAFPLIIFRNRRATEAMRESYERVRPYFGGFLLLLAANVLLILIANALGSLAFGLGWLLFSPLAQAIICLMQLQAYREFFGLSEQDLAIYT